MTDEELLDQGANVPTMYFDGFGAYRKVNGVLRCIGFVCGVGAQLNLVVSLVGADEANRQTRRALEEQGHTKGLTIWNGAVLAH